MEQLVIVLIIGAISLGKWLLEKSAEQRARRDLEAGGAQPEPRPADPVRAPRPIAAPLPDIDRTARRLREALGLPEGADLPMPPRRSRRSPLPPPVLVYEAPELERRVVSPPAPRPKAAPSPTVEKATAQGALGDLLRSREGLRKAILAQEILGPPKGLVF